MVKDKKLRIEKISDDAALVTLLNDERKGMINTTIKFFFAFISVVLINISMHSRFGFFFRMATFLFMAFTSMILFLIERYHIISGIFHPIKIIL